MSCAVLVVSFFLPKYLRWGWTFPSFALQWALVCRVNVPWLRLQFFSGLPPSRWKLVQMAGRVGRRQGERAIFITVVPKNQRYRGACFKMFATIKLLNVINWPTIFWVFFTCFLTVSAEEKEEFKCVRNLFSSDACINKGIYETFCIENPYGQYTFVCSRRASQIKFENGDRILYSNNLVYFQLHTREQRFWNAARAAGAAVDAQLRARNVGMWERARRKQPCVHLVWTKTVMQL